MRPGIAQVDMMLAGWGLPPYQDLIEGGILRPCKVTALQRDAFRAYMKSQGKLGGQNKVPRLSNDRQLAEALAAYALEGPG